MASRLELPEEQLRRLYVEEGLPSTVIAQRLGCHPLTVRARLKDYGISLRPRGSHRLRRHVPDSLLSAWPTPRLAYAVGLLASDGNLPKRNNCAVLTTTDAELAQLFRTALELPTAHIVEIPPRPPRKRVYIVQVCDHVFREFLALRGLTPAKTLNIKALDIPDQVFADFLRGELDGDGGWVITRGWRDFKYLIGKFTSKSPHYLEWLRVTIARLTGLEGVLSGHALVFNGQKAESLGAWLYREPGDYCLARKRKVWSTWMATKETKK